MQSRRSPTRCRCRTARPRAVLGPSTRCDPCYTPCPKTVSGCRTEKHCETVCCPVTKCKKVAECVPVTKTICTYECRPVTKTVCTYECRPVTKQVTCYECVTKTVAVPVTRTRCVPTVETQTKTVNVRKCVAYQATRQVCVNEAVKEKVKVTRWSPRWSRRTWLSGTRAAVCHDLLLQPDWPVRSPQRVGSAVWAQAQEHAAPRPVVRLAAATKIATTAGPTGRAPRSPGRVSRPGPCLGRGCFYSQVAMSNVIRSKRLRSSTVTLNTTHYILLRPCLDIAAVQG